MLQSEQDHILKRVSILVVETPLLHRMPELVSVLVAEESCECVKLVVAARYLYHYIQTTTDAPSTLQDVYLAVENRTLITAPHVRKRLRKEFALVAMSPTLMGSTTIGAVV